MKTRALSPLVKPTPWLISRAKLQRVKPTGCWFFHTETLDWAAVFHGQIHPLSRNRSEKRSFRSRVHKFQCLLWRTFPVHRQGQQDWFLCRHLLWNRAVKIGRPSNSYFCVNDHSDLRTRILCFLTFFRQNCSSRSFIYSVHERSWQHNAGKLFYWFPAVEGVCQRGCSAFRNEIRSASFCTVRRLSRRICLWHVWIGTTSFKDGRNTECRYGKTLSTGVLSETRCCVIQEFTGCVYRSVHINASIWYRVIYRSTYMLARSSCIHRTRHM